MRLARILSAGVLAVLATPTLAGQTLQVDMAGSGSRFEATQHGSGTYGHYRSQGDNIETRWSQFGSNGGVNLDVRGQDLDLHVFPGICPPGSKPVNLTVEGRGDTVILVPGCN